MSQNQNEFGQPIGAFLPDWQPVPRPPRTPIDGRFCRIEALDPDRHAADLFAAFSDDPDGRAWTYMAVGPFASEADLRSWMEPAAKAEDPLFYALIDTESGKAVGQASFLRIEPAHGVIEVGNIAFSPRLQRTPIATEAMYLMMCRVFDELGFRLDRVKRRIEGSNVAVFRKPTIWVHVPQMTKARAG